MRKIRVEIRKGRGTLGHVNHRVPLEGSFDSNSKNFLCADALHINFSFTTFLVTFKMRYRICCVLDTYCVVRK